MEELYKYIQIDEHDDFYLAFDVEEREKEYKALVAERDKEAKGLRAEIRAADNILATYKPDDYCPAILLHDRVFSVTQQLEAEVERLKEEGSIDRAAKNTACEYYREARAKLKKAIHELWRHQNNAQTNEVLADIEKPDEPRFTVPLTGEQRHALRERKMAVEAEAKLKTAMKCTVYDKAAFATLGEYHKEARAEVERLKAANKAWERLNENCFDHRLEEAERKLKIAVDALAKIKEGYGQLVYQDLVDCAAEGLIEIRYPRQEFTVPH